MKPANAVPLVIGVTGHRDLVAAEIPQITKQVRDLLHSLQERYPHLPIRVMTSLAEGADTLVADLALELGCEVINLLPMPIEYYREDFNGAALETFDRLVSCSETHELPLVSASDDASQPGEARDAQYARLGTFMTAHAHILLALWDGKFNQAVGGTGEVVQFHQQGLSESAGTEDQRSLLDIRDDESDLVYHVVCSRASSGGPEDELKAGSAAWLTRDVQVARTSELPQRYHNVFSYMSKFSEDAQSIDVSEFAYPLEPAPADDAHDAPLNLIRQAFDVSDGLATYFQRRVLWALRITLGSAVFAGLSFILYADFSGLDGMIWGYLVFVTLAVGGYLLARQGDWQRRYLDYRVLAEGLRVQFYWALSGVGTDQATHYSHDRFFEGKDLELGWVRNIMRYTGFPADVVGASHEDDLRAAIQYWVGDADSGQLGYYDKRAGEKLRHHRSTQWLITGCFLAGLLAALILAFGQGMAMSQTTSNLLVALMGLLPILAAARQNYSHRLAERELVAQYESMRQVFQSAYKLIRRTRNPARQRRILRDLGDAALMENEQWVLRQRQRPLPGGDAMT
jgi:hypothetical protein